MKKMISLALSVAMLSLCLAGCDQEGAADEKWTTYCGIVERIEFSEGLFVNIPDVGVSEIPSYEEGRQENLTIREGDVITMTFRGEDIAIMESYPARFSEPVYSIEVCRKNFEFLRDGDGYLLTVDYTEQLHDEFREKTRGDTVYLVEIGGTVNDAGCSVGYQRLHCSATIEGIAGSRISFRLGIDPGCAQEFLQKYCMSTIVIMAEWEY